MGRFIWSEGRYLDALVAGYSGKVLIESPFFLMSRVVLEFLYFTVLYSNPAGVGGVYEVKPKHNKSA